VRNPDLGLLVDSGFFIALYNERDHYHAAALKKLEWLEMLSVILPWPVLYETMNTRLARRPEVLSRFDALVRDLDAHLIDDSPYRELAYSQTMSSSRLGEPVSLVDSVLGAIIEDVNIPVRAMLTFNHRDFTGLCAQNSVELL